MNLNELIHIVAEPYIPETLISPSYLAKIKTAGQHFPVWVTSFFGFERKLGEAEPAADFLFCLNSKEEGRNFIAGKHQERVLGEKLKEKQAWQRAVALCEAWCNEDHFLHDKLENLWMEFDTGDCRQDVPVPSVFFGPQNNRTDTALDAVMGKKVTEMGLEILFDKPLDESLRHHLRLCFDNLPEKAVVFQVGAMIARGVEGARICIEKIKVPDILPFLTSLGWNDPSGRIRQYLDDIDRLTDYVCLDIDIDAGGIRPKIGIECYVNMDTDMLDKWKHFFDYLEAKQLCLPEVRNVVDKYYGMVMPEATGGRWPSHLEDGLSLIGNKFYSMYIRVINHVKISYHPGQPAAAKVYLRVFHQWINRNVFNRSIRQAHAGVRNQKVV